MKPIKSSHPIKEYNGFWWIGLISEIDENQGDVKVDFFHPHGPRKTFNWLLSGDTCYVPLKNILCIISTPVTTTGRTYKISGVDYENTLLALEKQKKKKKKIRYTVTLYFYSFCLYFNIF